MAMPICSQPCSSVTIIWRARICGSSIASRRLLTGAIATSMSSQNASHSLSVLDLNVSRKNARTGSRFGPGVGRNNVTGPAGQACSADSLQNASPLRRVPVSTILCGIDAVHGVSAPATFVFGIGRTFLSENRAQVVGHRAYQAVHHREVNVVASASILARRNNAINTAESPKVRMQHVCTGDRRYDRLVIRITVDGQDACVRLCRDIVRRLLHVRSILPKR